MTSAAPPPADSDLAAAARAARVRFVLVQPSHAGNIGAAARAIKAMGFDGLHVVAPKHAEFASDPEAVALATHGADVLAAARAHATLEEALAGVSLALAMTGYAREFGAPLVDLRSGAALVADEVRRAAAEVAFVFGTERSGLTNAQVEQCQRCCAIPADPQHGSLNLAQAVMVTAYECRLALLGGAVPAESAPYADDPAASVDRLEAFYAHLERALIAAGFLDGDAPKKLMPRLRRLFARARPSAKELDILRGICATLEVPKRERIGRKGGNWCRDDGCVDERGGRAQPASRIAPPSYGPPSMFARLSEDIACIRDRDPAARSTWEVLTCYPGLHALWLHHVAHACWRHGLRWLGRFVSHLSRWFTGIEIHPGAVIGRRVVIDHGMGIVIGETAEIGDDCTIYHGATLGGTSLAKGAKRHPTLGRGVIIGAGAKVLGGFTVGDGARVGSNAVVVKEVPAGATAVGNPARVLHKDLDAQREAAANRMGFSAYGVGAEGDDPLVKALHGLIDFAASQQQEIEQLKSALARNGIAIDAAEPPKVDPQQLNRLVDE